MKEGELARYDQTPVQGGIPKSYGHLVTAVVNHGMTGLVFEDERGVTAVIVGLSMTTLMGFSALAVEVGLWYADKRLAQNAADVAAYSAAVSYAAGDTASMVTATATPLEKSIPNSVRVTICRVSRIMSEWMSRRWPDCHGTIARCASSWPPRAER